MVSVVCPFYNEEIILAKAIDLMIANLQSLEEEWELILVNDGSLDTSLSIATEKASRDQRVKVVTYANNQGRGHALRKGIDAAQDDIIITTEIDCSWGDDIVLRLTAELDKHKYLDMVIASPNLLKNGYVNVPFKRVFFSKIGNVFLGFMITKKITMFTGMTRGYRAAAIKNLPTNEVGKEFHLDVITKAHALGLKIGEIPATLTWQDERLAKADAPKRNSSSNIKKIIFSHLVFGIGGRPFRYLFIVSLFSFLLSMAFLTWGIVNLFSGQDSIYLLILSFSTFILSVLLSGIGILSMQQSAILREIWFLHRELKETPDRKG